MSWFNIRSIAWLWNGGSPEAVSNTAPMPSDIRRYGGTDVGPSNPFHVTGTIAATGAELRVETPVEADNYDLQAAAYSVTKIGRAHV